MSDLADKRIVERAKKITGLSPLSALYLIGVIDHQIGFRKWDVIVEAFKSARELPRVDHHNRGQRVRSKK